MSSRSIGLSGQQLAIENRQKFEAWVTERNKANDWRDYVRGKKLNRSEIATECKFGLAVFRQNPTVKSALATLEEQLRMNGIIECESTLLASSDEVEDVTEKAADKRLILAKAQAEARVKILEEQNATLRAEIFDLRGQLLRFKHIDDHLSRTGRLLAE
jgi:hypothetical protein